MCLESKQTDGSYIIENTTRIHFNDIVTRANQYSQGANGEEEADLKANYASVFLCVRC